MIATAHPERHRTIGSWITFLTIILTPVIVYAAVARFQQADPERLAQDPSVAYGQLSRWANFAVVQPTTSCLPPGTQLVATTTAPDIVQITYAPDHTTAGNVGYDVYESPVANSWWKGLTRHTAPTGTILVAGAAWRYWNFNGRHVVLERTFPSGTHVALVGGHPAPLKAAAVSFNCAG